MKKSSYFRNLPALTICLPRVLSQTQVSPMPALSPKRPLGLTRAFSLHLDTGLILSVTLAMGISLTLMTGFAHAHGDSKHGNRTTVAPAEQKPWGIAGDVRKITRNVDIAMNDRMRFVPNRLEFRQGETVRLRIRNVGAVMHELVIGTQAELDQHAALMMKFPDMEHDEPYMAHVGPGKKGELVWTFNRAGDFDFACLIAGHYQAGMVGKIKVTAPGNAER